MLAALVRRFTTREAVMSTAAQLALTWGANHLSGVIAAQAEQLDTLTAERDALQVERDEMRATIDAMIDAADMPPMKPEQPDSAYAFTPMKPYPAPEDTDPLERGDDQADALADLEEQVNR